MMKTVGVRGYAAVLYAVVITPLGIWYRLTGADPLKRKLDPDQQSYWEVPKVD